MIATKTDLAKKAKNETKFAKGLDENGLSSEKYLVTALRGAIRQAWMKHPTKLLYLSQRTYADMNASTRTKWLVDCEICKGAFKKTDVEVDHIHGNKVSKSLDDMAEFAKSILMVSFDDLQCLCKTCHGIKTYSDLTGLSFEESRMEKRVIAHTKVPPKVQIRQLGDAGFTAAETSNAEKRRDCYRILLQRLA